MGSVMTATTLTPLMALASFLLRIGRSLPASSGLRAAMISAFPGIPSRSKSLQTSNFTLSTSALLGEWMARSLSTIDRRAASNSAISWKLGVKRVERWCYRRRRRLPPKRSSGTAKTLFT